MDASLTPLPVTAAAAPAAVSVREPISGAVPVVLSTEKAGARENAAPQLTSATLYRMAAWFFASRLLILAAAALSRAVMIPGPFASQGSSLARLFARWDSNWYLDIATQGYGYDPNAQSAVAFYPLYPMLIRGLTHLGFDPLVAGYLISNACLLGACVLLWRLAALETRSEAAANASVLFLLFYPGSLWCSMIYTESLFLLLMLGCLLAARRRRWLLAALAGYAAALTRTPGLLAGAFLAVEAAQQWWEDRRAERAGGAVGTSLGRGLLSRWRTGLGVIAPALGHASYLLFLQLRFGDWRAQQKTFAAGWNVPPFQAPWRALHDNWVYLAPFYLWIALTLAGLAVLLGVVALFAFRSKGYAALIFILMLLYISSTDYHCFARFTGTVVPIYLVLGWVVERLPVLEKPLLVLSTMLLTFLTALLIAGYNIN